MNVLTKADQHAPGKSYADAPGEADIDLDQLVKAARRQIWVLLAFCVIGVAFGAAYIAQSVPRYTATSVLIIDSTKDKSSISASIADLTYDSGAIDSQLEVLKSEGTASSVLSALNLTTNEEFLRVRESGFSRWLGAVRRGLGFGQDGESAEQAAAPEGEDARARLRRAQINQLQGSLDVRRVGRSYVINIDYTAADPVLAATVANGFAHAYVNDQLAASFNAMQQTGVWLEKRTADFKTRWINSDLELQRYKADHNLITAEGKLLGDQQLTQLSSQYTIAQSDTAKALARYSQIDKLIADNDIDGVVAETLASPVINELRNKYLRTAEAEKQVSAALGADQQQAVALRQSMADYKTQMFSEMRRIAKSYKSDAEVARSKEESLRQSIAALAQDNTVMDQRLVPLRVLEGEVNSNRQVYEALIQRYQEVQERQTLPEAEARIITAAAPPTTPAYPKKSVVMALSLVFGMLAGIAVGAVRENRDRVFRTAADVRNGLRLDFLGMLPAVKSTRIGKGRDEDSDPTHIRTDSSVLRYCLDQPFSSFTETLQGMKVAADLNIGRKTAKVIGIASVSPHEGKTTVSKNFASLLARMGERVLLIDGDLHQRGLTTALADHAEYGLLEVVRGQKTIDECLMSEPASGLNFLPTVVKVRLPHSSHVLSSPGMRRIIEDARSAFDYVVVDLPPVGPVVGVRAASSLFDGFVLVVEWGHTVQAMVRNTILIDAEITSKCLGVVYNKVRMNKIRLYEGMGSKAFHHEEFGDYFKA